MRHRRRHRRTSVGVEINLAAMLDMAFQLLAFFILTFRPAPIEGHLRLHMPPPVPLTNLQQVVEPKSSDKEGEAFLTTLDIYLFSDDDGEMTKLAIGFQHQDIFQGRLTPENLRKLTRMLEQIFDGQDAGFDQVQLVIDHRLRYDNLMKVVDVCTKQKLPDGQLLHRISFLDLKQSEAG